MPTTLEAHPPPRAILASGRAGAARFGFALLCLVLLAGWALAIRDPARVDLVLRNPGSCDVWVRLAPASGAPAIDLGSVPAGGELPKPRTLDPGGAFWFSYSSAGASLGAEERSRDDLERAGWVLSMPERAPSPVSGVGCAPPTLG